MWTRTLLFALLILPALAPAARARLWDYDTLRDEQRGLPGVAEILAGRWERHSEFFYASRAADMRALLAGEPGNAADLDRGIEQIRLALEINPDAHFGREAYQLRLAEHLRAGRDDPRGLERSFVKTVKGDTAAAVEGVVGMIRFGTGTSPLLYEALGDLLTARGDQRLAARAYLRAGEFGHPDSARIAVKLQRTVAVIDGTSAAELRTAFAAEKADAAAWVGATRGAFG